MEGPGKLSVGRVVVLTANHVTNFDVLPLQFSLPRPIFLHGKASLFKIPVLKLPIRVGSLSRQSRREG
ncbi:MAG: 1-acyl-sn-glycerol-3-phosphate acyltransferase [Anaerolineales bacterium]|nr:1-acyl-sn-glycerol-3-phosphate acyltransferase [Anaerolineales bacterium]